MEGFNYILDIYIIGFIFNFTYTLIWHIIVGYPFTFEVKKIYFNLWVFISPDFWVAYSQKERIKQYFKEICKDKNIKKERVLTNFIKKSNYINLLTSFLIVFLIFLIITPSSISKNTVLEIVSILIIRTISRSFEITYAFYKDVIDRKRKNSNLTAGERISLGIKSYIETILNYAVIYYLLAIYYTKTECEFFKCFEIYEKQYCDLSSALFISIGISSFTGISVSKLNYIAVLQLFSTMALVYFALARYIGKIDEDNKPLDCAVLKSECEKIITTNKNITNEKI